MTQPVIVALDLDNEKDLETILAKLGKPQDVFIKIGMELFFNAGPNLVSDLAKKGYKIFLDLKMNDIPNTVYNGARQLARLGIKLTTVHALGGSEMIKAAKQGLIDGSLDARQVPKLLVVTELTSISPSILKNEQNCNLSMKQQVISLAKLAKNSNADGVICSALEVRDLRQAIGDNFLYITPGIRMDSNTGDQMRVTTPTQAKEWGASAIVVGRPIIQADNPEKMYQKFKKEFN
ncbi:orotidine-5'-phosphate decarboxylase [Lactobacillus colini]|uniref:Orotidine 5'-phosphate decarboxylase n=1 Tax=Lactobacillus colini TaxID=1819254 RepID=A0ABS4MC17_9LACO|nr:orotidine-5'-phosphate decarboxylase [Lactobacillus colini]MBP2057215.1 orotidine-5'-phosphate decarboxylase [Lactobacillus colini]